MTDGFHSASMAVHRYIDLGTLRSWLSDELQRSGWRHDQVADLTLAVHEAAKNALTFSGGSAKVTLHLTSASLMICVADEGPGFQPALGKPFAFPPPYEVSGRGLPLIHHMVDRLDIDSRPGANIVRIQQRRPEPTRAA